MKLSLALLTLSALALASTDASAQKLYGLNGPAGLVWEFSSLPAGPCAAPAPMPPTAFPYIAPPPCGGPVAGPTPFPGPGSFGDIASDRLTDTVYVCDGFVIEQYAEYSPLTTVAAGTPINSFPVPAILGLGLPITGMGMDSGGVTTGGIPTLYITDGIAIVGIVPSPPGSCGPAAISVAPFKSPFVTPPGTLLTDVTVDPASGSLLACDSIGMIHSVFPGGFPGPFGFIPAAAGCGMGPFLEGIAMDLATTPSLFGTPPAFYVTDGFTVTYQDVFGTIAGPTFYTPTPCNPTPAPLNGLAYASHSVSFGAPAGPATLSSFGQSSAPGPTYGLEVKGIPAPSFLFLVSGTNVPGPGFFCPPLAAVGNPLWVNPFVAPGAVTPLFFAPGPTAVIPAPLPAALPPGLEVYLQVFLDLTPGAPGGPWLSTNAVDMVVTAP